jgi:hypothetical protein
VQSVVFGPFAPGRPRCWQVWMAATSGNLACWAVPPACSGRAKSSSRQTSMAVRAICAPKLSASTASEHMRRLAPGSPRDVYLPGSRDFSGWMKSFNLTGLVLVRCVDGLVEVRRRETLPGGVVLKVGKSARRDHRTRRGRTHPAREPDLRSFTYCRMRSTSSGKQLSQPWSSRIQVAGCPSSAISGCSGSPIAA